ncbi:MAG TPA: 1-aminocyclopropane-1-carboxylate deaminase [Cytophagales bacterium]|nr:1-aminocyclopropane-1-carboxylate deaminase [Cytophagales bacterium]
MPLPTTFLPNEVPLQRLQDVEYEKRGVEVWVKRDDLIHPQVSGNKWRKLKYVVADALEKSATKLITFGGAHSNHLLALAAVSHHLHLTAVGVVRGEQAEKLSPTLQACQEFGMQLHFVSRSDYRRKSEPDFQQELLKELGTGYLIPEGGTSSLALPGVAEIWQELDQPFDFLYTAVGTGGTLAGLVSVAPRETQLVGVLALKGYQGQMEKDVESLLASSNSSASTWKLIHDAHHGGYAKATPELVHFVKEWPQNHRFLLDPIYTGKVFYHLHKQILTNQFPANSRICVLHTGGLQGIEGFNQRWGSQLPTSL